MNKNLRSLIVVMGIISTLAAALFAQEAASPYTVRLQPFLTGLSRPILLRGALDGTKRIFIVQQSGIIKVLQPGSTTPTDFINLSSKIVIPGSTGDERGLLGLTFHPDFATNGKFYVDYSQVGTGATRIVEYRVSASNPNQGDITTERVILTIPQPFSNHNGGMVEFGPDGYLYIGMGDGGSANDPGNRAQNRSLLLGKILRIDVNIPMGSPVPYLIPSTNPFTGASTTRCDGGSTTSGNTCQEIWTLGMRNPWRWSFDRGGVNALWVADVGQGSVEEVDVIPNGGGNYGWRVYEGTSCTNLDPSLCIPGNYIMPLFVYNHTGGRCSITGGFVYRGTQGSLPDGAFTYGDYCSGEVLMWNNNAQVLLQDTPRSVVSFGQDDDSELYVCYNNGQIDRISRAKASADFDGDFKTDISAVHRDLGANKAYWSLYRTSTGAFETQEFGIVEDIPAPEDFDGDNISDLAVFRPSNGTWYFLASGTSTINVVQFGASGDIPAAGDYDGDAKADYTIYRPSTGVWWSYRSSDLTVSAVAFGLPTDIPVAGDYDGDGKYDVSVFRPADGNWHRLNSLNNAYSVIHFGLDGDIPAPGDFDGDGRIDNAVFRPSSGVWYILQSANASFRAAQFGLNGDIPVVGDYDGDGKEDIAIYRQGAWWGLKSSNGAVFAATLGGANDLPVPKYDAP